jgi:hypothetical protein
MSVQADEIRVVLENATAVSPTKLATQFHSDAAQLAGCGVLDGQDSITVIDGRPQHS